MDKSIQEPIIKYMENSPQKIKKSNRALQGIEVKTMDKLMKIA